MINPFSPLVGGVRDLLQDELSSLDRVLALLPLAHILEMVVELTVTFYGAYTGYARIKTLTDNSVRNCAGDIRAFRPTIMAGVPAVWENMRKAILHKVQEGGVIKKALFDGSLSLKRAKIPILSHVAEKLVLSKIKEVTGGQLRYVLSGGAPLSKETQEFLGISLVMILQGTIVFTSFVIRYLLTDTCFLQAMVSQRLQLPQLSCIPGITHTAPLESSSLVLKSNCWTTQKLATCTPIRFLKGRS